MSLSIAFAGTPDFAATALKAVLTAGYEIPLVLTQPDRPAGRGMKLQPSAVKAYALMQNLPVVQPPRLSTPEEQQALHTCRPDVLVVAAYGLLLPPAVLAIPRFGCINIHASLLPRWRGAAPIQRAIEAGDTHTGITIMQMDKGLDTGDMLLSEAIPITPDDTGGSLHDKLATLGGKLIVTALEKLSHNTLVAKKQQEDGCCYAAKITKTETAIDWTTPAETLERKIRAFSPFPGTSSLINNTQVKIHQCKIIAGSGEPGTILQADKNTLTVACGHQALSLLTLQKPGGKKLPVDEFLHGFPLQKGMRFSIHS